MVKVSFYGAAGQVTGSNFLVETDEHRYVVDCGLFQGSAQAASLNAEEFHYDPSKVEAVIITHAHLDHIGRLPKLVKEGFRGPIYATLPTIELTTLTLKDAYGLMEHRQLREKTPMLYDQADLQRTLDMFKPIEYHQAQQLFGNDSVMLFDAGHILGSASVQLTAGGKKIAFSGDVGHYPNILLPHFETPFEADCIITEGTYGGVEHEDKQDRMGIVRDALEWTIQNRGVLLIPAFSIERSQELLYLLNHLFVTHRLPKLPIYLDSPLAIEALEIFERHVDYFSESVQVAGKKDDNVFTFRGLALTPTVEDSKDINEQQPPKVIIAGSGMMEGGRIIHHLKRYLSHPTTGLLVIGYQAEGTLGRKIVDGATEINIDGRRVPVKAHIKVVDIFSGHADNSDLIEWLKAIKLSQQGSVYIVHSDPERAEVFQKNIEAVLPGANVNVARNGESVEL